MEDFVSFEIAKKLKEKGFREKCFAFYYKQGGFQWNCMRADTGLVNVSWACLNYNDIVNGDKINAPTISQVLKWLREKKEVDLVIEPIFIYDENKRREYGVRVFAPQLNKPVNCGYFNMWDDGSIAGIEYVIDNNLI